MADITRYDSNRPARGLRVSVNEPDNALRVNAAPLASRTTVNTDNTRILVVDDDPQVLKLVARMIEHIGYRCTTAPDALDALFYLNQTGHQLVITDFNMPVMNGLELADQIKRRYCGTKVIIMTGQSEAYLNDRMQGCRSVDGLLFKPFNLNVMRNKIEAVICEG